MLLGKMGGYALQLFVGKMSGYALQRDEEFVCYPEAATFSDECRRGLVEVIFFSIRNESLNKRHRC
jgi:hypothetical protein